MNSLGKIAFSLIERYQQKGGGKNFLYVDCNYTPTCSEYTKQAINRYGFFFGMILGWKRIRKCNNPDAVKKVYDPVPDKQ